MLTSSRHPLLFALLLAAGGVAVARCGTGDDPPAADAGADTDAGSPTDASSPAELAVVAPSVRPHTSVRPLDTGAGYDPTWQARAADGRVSNLEAGVPSMCYTRTDGTSNPCWTCHTVGQPPTDLTDVQLQVAYAFSDVAKENHWTNLFEDRSEAALAISDDEVLAHLRTDNYAPLAAALRELAEAGAYPGYVPDLDLEAGFDEAGFARDGSGWRALRYLPFPGTFWPTNGSTDDVFIRLPERFRSARAEDGSLAPSRAVYAANLAILEAAVASDPRLPDAELVRAIEPIDEAAIDLDLDGDGELGTATVVRGLPPHYVGAARDHRVRRRLFPEGTELLHSVRYLDPDAPTLMATHMKELRYMVKREELDDWRIRAVFDQELEDKERGRTPVYPGSALVGLQNGLGWQLQGFIEDAEGRLRLQTEQEHRFCMGCHGGIGVTADATFSFARKVPGLDGWRPQDLRGLQDRPQVGHADPEVLTYLRRVGAGDELRENDEMRDRFVPGGPGTEVNEAEVRRAAAGGDRDLAWLLAPSRERALQLDKAYLAIARAQTFEHGRDPLLRPAANVHPRIENEATGLDPVFFDGRLHPDWGAPTE